MNTKDKYDFEDLREIVRILRSPDGCKWDGAQTHESLRTCLIEECYEVLEAVDNKDMENLQEELGDVLLQVVFHSQIADEEGCFNLEDVVDEVSKKLIRRHPHVFDKDNTCEMPDWESIKKQEKAMKNKAVPECELDSIPKSFPAHIRAQKVLKKAEQVYGYKKDANEVLDDISATILSMKNSINGTDFDGLDCEIENLLLNSINLARILGKNSENSLTNAVEKFITRVKDITL